MYIDPALQRSTALFAAILLVIYLTRPRVLFDDSTSRPRPFGLGFNRDSQKRTLFSLSTIIPPLACLSWIIAGDG